MADTRRLVTLDNAGTATLVKDLETGAIYTSVRGSFTVKAPPRNQILAKRERRYGGAQVVGERHDNGSIAWKMLVNGTSADNALLNIESVLMVLESARTDLYYEWRPEGATSSVFYEVQGPATYQATHEYAQWAGAKSMYIDVEIPVAPLARGTPVDYPITANTLAPFVFSMTGVPGDAPALANVQMRTDQFGVANPAWAMFGWTKHSTGSTIAGGVNAIPFGIFEAENMSASGGPFGTGGGTISDANYRGSSGIRAVTATATSPFQLLAGVDPATLVADDFSQAGEVDIEVWARVEIAATVVAPTIMLSAAIYDLSGAVTQTYTPEFGVAGRPLVLPSSGTVFRMVRLGVLTLPVNTVNPARWAIKLLTSWSAGSTGNFGIDYLLMVPAKARACGKTGVPEGGPFVPSSSGSFDRTIYGADLSGSIALAGDTEGRYGGLGGSPIELPPGDVDMLIKLSSLTPDNPTVDTTTEALSHKLITGNVHVIPRYFLAKGQ